MMHTITQSEATAIHKAREAQAAKVRDAAEKAALDAWCSEQELRHNTQ